MQIHNIVTTILKLMTVIQMKEIMKMMLKLITTNIQTMMSIMIQLVNRNLVALVKTQIEQKAPN